VGWGLERVLIEGVWGWGWTYTMERIWKKSYF